MDRTNRIVFVGTGGGGSMVGLQELSTGGMWWNVQGVDFYVDPGPGCVWHLRRSISYKLDPADLTAIFVSHIHTDHVGDVNTLIEASYWAKMVANGTLEIGKGQVIKPDEMVPGHLTLFIPEEGIDPEKGAAVSAFHHSMLRALTLTKPSTVYPLGPLTLRTTASLPEKPWYKDVEEYGFWIEEGTISVGYLPETFYREGLFEAFHPEILIMNALFMKNEREGWESVIQNAHAIRPRTIILRHFSSYALRYGREKLAQELSERTGIETTIAYDFSMYDLKERTWIQRLS